VDEKTRNAKTVVSVGLSFIQEERRSLIHPRKWRGRSRRREDHERIRVRVRV
jgi:hypothetical protein